MGARHTYLRDVSWVRVLCRLRISSDILFAVTAFLESDNFGRVSVCSAIFGRVSICSAKIGRVGYVRMANFFVRFVGVARCCITPVIFEVEYTGPTATNAHSIAIERPQEE